jgi:hypothetical protein
LFSHTSGYCFSSGTHINPASPANDYVVVGRQLCRRSWRNFSKSWKPWTVARLLSIHYYLSSKGFLENWEHWSLSWSRPLNTSKTPLTNH